MFLGLSKRSMKGQMFFLLQDLYPAMYGSRKQSELGWCKKVERKTANSVITICIIATILVNEHEDLTSI